MHTHVLRENKEATAFSLSILAMPLFAGYGRSQVFNCNYLIHAGTHMYETKST